MKPLFSFRFQSWKTRAFGCFQCFSLLLLIFLAHNLEAQLAYKIDDVNGETLYLPGPQGSITIYDSGGPFGVYQNFEDYSVTICSDFQLAGCPPIPEINAIFYEFDVEAQANCTYDYLEIPDFGTYCNGNTPPLFQPFISSGLENPDGCMTLHFHSDLSIAGEGFEVNFFADYIPVSPEPLICGTSFEGFVGVAIEGCLSCPHEFDCGGNTYGPYYGVPEQYSIETTGITTLTITGGVDFFVYGRSTNIGPNGCPPVTSIACAVGNQSSVTFNADDYPFGIWVIITSYDGDAYNLSVQCGGACQACDHCFAFLPRYQSANVIDFQNRYCGEGGILSLQGAQNQHRSSVIAYDWDVPNANEQYTSGTNSASENPSIIFPGPGSYTVCETVYSGGVEVFNCCHTVFVGPCNVPPVAYFTAQAGAFDRFVLNTNGNGNNIQWTFSDPDVFFFQGNENSSNPVIVIPNQTCVTVCLYETNACGFSSYCIKLCQGNASCPGSTPPVYITSEIQPEVDDQTVSINLPNPPSGGQATYAWDFGDGTYATTKNISHTFPEYGNYMVCVVVTVGCRTWCYCWCVHLNPCVPIYTYNDNELEVEFAGSETALTYKITSSTPIAPGENWLVNGDPVNGNSTQLTYTFPSAGNYTICFPYLGIDGCVNYYCIDVGAGNPFACNNITWQYNATTGYRFNLPSGNSDILWTIDETKQDIGHAITSSWVLPINPCGWKTISVRYFDGVRYRICCLRIYLCAPDECYSSIDYGYLSGTNEATFKLNTTGNTDLTWYFDDAPTQTLGTATSLAIPYPGTCVSRWISVRYKDSSGRWRICCRYIYFCNPASCNIIQVKYNTTSGYSFTAQQAQENMSWIVEETQTALGTNQTSNYLPVSGTCDYRTVSLRYWLPGFGWKLCCIRVYWCDPVTCSDNITFSTSNNTLVLTAPDNLQSIEWYKDGNSLGSSNPQTTSLSSGTSHTICLRYLDLCDNAWKYCCRTYTSGGSGGNLIFDFDNKVCGSQNQIVEIPLRVKGFTNLKNFQFSVYLEDSLKGRLVEIIPGTISGDLETNVSNAATGRVFWESSTSVTIPDNTIIATAKITVLTNTTGESKITITGTPIPIYAEDGSGNEIVPVVRDGSFCFEHLVHICGKITREDNLPINNVSVSLNGCKQYTTLTDQNGQYCFNDIPAGSGYEIRASKDINYKNGVNTGDLSAIKRHILGTVKLNSPYKILAGDAKKNNGVNTGDVSELRRLIQNVITDLPTCESWEFTDKKYVFATPENPFSVTWPKSVVIPDLQQDVNDADLIGWKMGDVNLSNNPSAIAGSSELETRSVTDLYLSLSSVNLPHEDTFFLDVTAQQFDDVLNGSFSIQYDASKLELAGISNRHPALDLSDEEFVINPVGNMVFVWESSSGVTLPDSSVLFSLMFIP
ncbi:MAG: PKD domain-containing protein, partial [Saprospiraceae bacterium]